MSKLEHYKQRTQAAVMKNRDTIRSVVSTGELFLGATVGGYVAAQYPTIAKVPTDAGAGIALLAAGLALHQRDLTAFGVGLLAGYLHDMGAALAVEMPMSSSTTPLSAVP